MKEKKILVTGGTGFLGSHIIRDLLNNGYTDITAIHRNTSSFDLISDAKDRVNWIEASLSDLNILDELVREADIVIHSAAMVSFVPSQAKQMMKINVEGTKTLIDLSVYHNLEHFVYISSVAALGRKKPGEIINETAEWVEGPYNSKYAISKHLGELEVWRGQAEGINVTVLNPSYILGVGNWDEGATAIYKKIANGMPFYPKGANGVVDVKDVATLTRLLIDQQKYGERYIACAKNISHKNLFTKIANGLGRKPPHIAINGLIAGLGWRFEAVKAKLLGQNPIVTKETLQISGFNFGYDGSKALKVNGFEYGEVDKCIQNVCKSYLEQKSTNG